MSDSRINKEIAENTAALYRQMYHIMFNAATDAINASNHESAKFLLILAQRRCEQLYADAE